MKYRSDFVTNSSSSSYTCDICGRTESDWDISRSEAESMFNSVKSQFPENVVIAIPDDASLESCSKDVLENIISMISEVIDSL